MVGVAGSKSFAIEVKTLILLFIKNNLYLNNSKCFLIKGVNKKVQFLNYRVYLAIFSRKINIINHKSQNIKNYKRGVSQKLFNSNKKFAKASFYLARGSFLKIYENLLKSTKLKWSKSNLQGVSYNFISILNNIGSSYNSSLLVKR